MSATAFSGVRGSLLFYLGLVDCGAEFEGRLNALPGFVIYGIFNEEKDEHEWSSVTFDTSTLAFPDIVFGVMYGPNQL